MVSEMSSERVISEGYPSIVSGGSKRRRFQRLRSEAIADGISQSLDKEALTIPGVLFTTRVVLTPRHFCFTENSSIELSFLEVLRIREVSSREVRLPEDSSIELSSTEVISSNR